MNKIDELTIKLKTMQGNIVMTQKNIDRICKIIGEDAPEFTI